MAQGKVVENLKRLYVKAGLFLAIALCPIYISMWYNQHILASIFLTLMSSISFYFVIKLLKSNTKLKNELRKNLYIDLNTKLPNRLKLLKDNKKLDPNIDSTLIIIKMTLFKTQTIFTGITLEINF